MQIVDTAGAPVGTVTAIKGDNLQVKTDKHEALLPKSSFTVEQRQAAVRHDPGAARFADRGEHRRGAGVDRRRSDRQRRCGHRDRQDRNASTSGKVTIALSSGKKIQVPSTGLRGNPDGTVTIGYTAEQLEALVNGCALPRTRPGK